MYMLLNVLIASPVINICSTVAWCRPYPWWYFTIFYFQCFPLAGLRLRFFWYVFPQDRQLLGCFFGRWFLIIPCSFSFCSDLAARSGCSFSLQVCSLLATRLPLRQVFFWPAILTPRYPVSGTPLPLRHDFSDRLFWRPGLPFPVPQGLLFAPCFGVLDRLFRRPPFFPPNLPFPVTWVAGSLFVPPCGSPAIFTAPRFLPLRGFYRSAVFIAPLSPVFWGLCSSAALLLAAPQSSPSSGRTLWCRLVRSVSGGPPFLTLFLYRLLDHSRSVTAHLAGSPFVHFVQIKGPSIVSSFECRDTGTACTSTSLWNLTAHGNKAFSPQTDGSAVCRYAYWSMKWLYLQMARSQSVVWFPPHSPDTRSPGPRDSLIFNWNILLHHNTL